MTLREEILNLCEQKLQKKKIDINDIPRKLSLPLPEHLSTERWHPYKNRFMIIYRGWYIGWIDGNNATIDDTSIDNHFDVIKYFKKAGYNTRFLYSESPDWEEP